MKIRQITFLLAAMLGFSSSVWADCLDLTMRYRYDDLERAQVVYYLNAFYLPSGAGGEREPRGRVKYFAGGQEPVLMIEEAFERCLLMGDQCVMRICSRRPPAFPADYYDQLVSTPVTTGAGTVLRSGPIANISVFVFPRYSR